MIQKQMARSDDPNQAVLFHGTLPIPPSVNESYKVVKVWRVNKQSGQKEPVYRIGPTEELERFNVDAGWMLKSARNYCNRSLLAELVARRSKRKKVPLRVEVTFYFATPWRSDTDGRIKHAQDATFGHLGLNDNQVVDVRARKRVDRANQRCEILIVVLNQWEGI